ncbi:hypothetical protein J2S10_003274 [Neobacillus ginsengisoli]|uniref:YolD-like family protein n=1 Tax=Neobacillus ginsengisoli TaxID=904295 RepID=A0ABT9XWZ9_9BACI|nr:hypothetical protein [Neobacillus ginsengisoli]
MNSEEVLYNGNLYTIIYKYTSGYCEIREVDNKLNVVLVHESEVHRVHERPLSR